MPGNAGFYSSDKKKTPVDVRFKCKKKFESKILIWLAISYKGISAPYISSTRGPAINTEMYTKKCQPKLFKFYFSNSNDKIGLFKQITQREILNSVPIQTEKLGSE